MYQFAGYDAFVATYENGDYPNLKYTPGLRLEFIPKISGDWVQDSCAWLRDNAQDIDVLNLYHLRPRSYSHICTYKHNNKDGKVYLKLDGAPLPRRFKLWKNIKPAFYLFASKVVSTELQDNAEILSRRWHRRIVWVPNPFNPNELSDFRPFSERNNTILTVGRLGTKQKATEILLEAFVRIAPSLPNWTLKLAGRIAENMNIADDFYSAHPDLKERVIFAGEIRDRNILTEMYRDAKIFAFPSRWESFGIALTEAMSQGCFAVATNIPSFVSLTENFRYALGSEVDDVDGLAKNLLYACTHEAEAEAMAREGMRATLDRCSLRRCCDVIAEGLK